MFTPTALMKPTITVLDTNRRTEPSRSTPATIINTPVVIVSVNSARAASSASPIASTSATMMAIAPVAWTAMNDELVASAPAKVPTRNSDLARASISSNIFD